MCDLCTPYTKKKKEEFNFYPWLLEMQPLINYAKTAKEKSTSTCLTFIGFIQVPQVVPEIKAE